MCPQSSAKSDSIQRGFMSEEIFDKIVNEIKDFAFEIFIQLAGEPLLHHKLTAYIKKAREKGLRVGISTNGSLLKGNICEDIINAGLDKLVITFTDRGDKYKRIWQGGDYGEVEKNIEEFLSKRNKRRRPEVTLQIIKFFGEDKSLNMDKGFTEKWTRLGVNSFSPIWATYWTGDFKEEAMLRYRQAPRDTYYRPCGAIWRSVAVHWNGDVSACCNDLMGIYILGNVEKESIAAIWNGEYMVKLREDLIRQKYKDIKLCRNCLALWGRLPSEKRRWYAVLENMIKKNV
jgi:radical SAM protein with 4Fe4S-binding SPASM domain